MINIRNLAVLSISVAAMLSGCSMDHREQAAKAYQKRHAMVNHAPKAIDLAKVKPNELGRVLILEYHDVGNKEGRWERKYDNFRSDLQRLYKLGYQPISLRDYVNNNINTSPGKSPVVFTFDDGTPGQFTYIKNGDRWKVDPKCAVGIMEEFHRQHPDWPLKATFYVYYPIPFGQKDLIARKFRHIIDIGMDIGNHTFTHTRLDMDTDTDAANEMALNVKSAERFSPGVIVDSIALPYGKGPRNISLLASGHAQGTSYHNIAALLVGAEPAPSPISLKFNAYHLPRVQAIQSELDMWLSYFKRHPDQRYVSDGDPNTVTVQKSLASGVDKAKLSNKKLRIY